jgi:hypothetical protein
LLSRLARLVAVGGAERPLVPRLCLACERLLDADGVALTIDYTSAHRVTACSTNEVSTRLEDLQDVLGEGPARLAYESGRAVTTRLTAEVDPRWPGFAGAAVRVVGTEVSLFALPVRTATETIGVLSMYKLPPGALSETLEAVQVIADAVGVALLRESADGTWPDETGSWASRARIHQATGMVIAQLGVDAADALGLLKARAYLQDITLDDVASLVVTRTLDFRGADHD